MSIEAITVRRSLVATSSRSRWPSCAAIALKARASGTNSAGRRLARRARRPVALAEALRHRRHHLDRLDDELLRGDQRAEQHEQADEAELQIGGADLAVDRGGHPGFVDADDQARSGAGDSRKADARASSRRRRRRKAIPRGLSEPSAFSAIADNSGTRIQRPADHAGLVRRRRQHGSGAVDQHGRNAGPAAEIAHDLRHPVEIDAGENDRIRIPVDGGYRIGRHHDRLVGEPWRTESR